MNEPLRVIIAGGGTCGLLLPGRRRRALPSLFLPLFFSAFFLSFSSSFVFPSFLPRQSTLQPLFQPKLLG